MKEFEAGRSPINKKATYVLAGGSMLALMGLLMDLQAIVPFKTNHEACQQVISPQAVLSRAQLTSLLSVAEQTDRQTLQAILQKPYCSLSPLKTPPDRIIEREVYPLAFDPDTWVILHYENNTYRGYDFSFQR